MLEFLFNKVAGLQACKFIKKKLQHRYFPVNIAKFLGTSILRNIREWVLLYLGSCQISMKKTTASKMSKYGVISGRYFPAFGLNTERYFVSLRIESKCWKIRTRNNSVFGHFSRVSLGIQSECGKIRTRNNSVFGHFSLSGLCSWHLAVNYFVKWFQHRSHCAWSAHVGSFSDTYFAEFVLIAVFVHKYPYSVSIFAYNVKYTLIMR